MEAQHNHRYTVVSTNDAFGPKITEGDDLEYVGTFVKLTCGATTHIFSFANILSVVDKSLLNPTETEKSRWQIKMEQIQKANAGRKQSREQTN